MVPRIFLLCLMVASTLAATWQGYEPEKPKELSHKKGCYVKEIEDVIPYRSTLTPIGYCYRIECSKGMMYYASCGVVMAGKGCHVTKEDLTKPYPECCPDVECDSDNDI